MNQNNTDQVGFSRRPSMTADELLSVNDVIAELGIARATFYRWRAVRKGPEALRLPNGTIRVRRSALDRFLADCAKRDRI